MPVSVSFDAAAGAAGAVAVCVPLLILVGVLKNSGQSIDGFTSMIGSASQPEQKTDRQTDRPTQEQQQQRRAAPKAILVSVWFGWFVL